MRTEKNSRELLATEAASTNDPFGNVLGPGPVGVGKCVTFVTTAATSAPGADALRITTAPACDRRRCDEPVPIARPRRRLSAA